jgi:hypothetical protein
MYLAYIIIGIIFLIGIIKTSKKIRKNPIDHKLGKNPTDHAFERNRLEKLLPREPEKVANNEVERKPEKIIVKVNTMSVISRIWNIALDIVTVAVFAFVLITVVLVLDKNGLLVDHPMIQNIVDHSKLYLDQVQGFLLQN